MLNNTQYYWTHNVTRLRRRWK